MQHPQLKREKPRRWSKRARALLATGLLALLAAGFALAVPRWIAANPGASAPMPTAELPYRTLATLERADITSIAVSQQGGEAYTLLCENGRLFLAGEDGSRQAVNEALGEAMLTAVTELSVENAVVEDAAQARDALGDMGLEPPQIAVTIRRGDAEQWLHLGAVSPETTYHYYRWSGDPGIYLCDAGTYEAFEYSASMLLPVEQPSVTASLLTRVTLQKRGAEPPLELGFSLGASGETIGALRSPYAYPMRADRAQSLANAAANLRLGARVATVTDENRAALGLDDPLLVLTLHQAAGYRTGVDDAGQLTAVEVAERTIRLAVLREDGDFFYQVEYEGVVYQMSRLLLQAFVEANADELCTRAPADMGDADIASLLVQLGAGSLDIRATRTERVQSNNQLETDIDGNVVYDTAVTANGAPIATEAFESLLARLRAMTVSGTLDEGWQPGDQAPRWQLTLTAVDGQTRALAAYPLDTFHDALTVDGVAVHTLYCEALDTALGELRALAR